MLQKIYKAFLRLHPPNFRDRFGDEMLSIFEQAATASMKIKLIGDLALSVLRQWSLRPEFWHEPAVGNAVPVSGAPEFLVFDNFRPRTGALIDGALLSAIVFAVVCFTMGYAWNHPVLIRIVQPYWRISRGAVAPQTSPSRSPAPVPIPTESPIYTEEGRVVLVLPSTRINTNPDAAVLPPMKTVNGQTLASYAGTYHSDAGQDIVVKLTPTEFTIQETASAPVALSPISETQFVGRTRHDYLVSFRANQSGVFNSLEITRNGAHISARR